MPKREAFLFVSCDGETGRSTSSMDHLKRQHAQFGNKFSNYINTPPLPFPFQIKFRPASQSNGVERYVGRCSYCRKRRKLTRWMGRCEPCDKHNALRPQCTATQCTTSDLAYGSDISPETCQASTRLAPVMCDIPCGGWKFPADRKAMHYFFHYAAVDLSGYILSDFWNGFVAQVSKSEPMVRQAVVAVSGAHLDRCSGDGLTSEASLGSYQASLNMLRKYMVRTDKASPVLVLLCCVLLFTFDRLHGDETAAAVHLQSAISILTNVGKRAVDDSSTSRVTSQDSLTHVMLRMDVPDLVHVLTRMDVADTMPRLDRGPLLDLPLDSPEAVANEIPPMKFFSPPDFREPWMQFCHAVFAFVGRNARYRHKPADQIPPFVLKHGRDLQRYMKTWRIALKDYHRRVGIPNASAILPSSTPNERVIDAINALIHESHYFIMKSILAEALPPPAGSTTGPWERVAEKILQCGEKALALRRAHRQMNSTATRKTFSTHVGIAESLLCLSHRTNSPDVRSRAQRLVAGFRDVSGDLTGMTAFFAGSGAPPQDLVLIYERPGH